MTRTAERTKPMEAETLTEEPLVSIGAPPANTGPFLREPSPEAPPPPAVPKQLFRVSLACPGPLIHRTMDIEAADEAEAKALFNKANCIGGSRHSYSIRPIAPGTPPDVAPKVVTTLQEFALQLADELDRLAREFAPGDRTRRVAIPDERVKQITDKLRELAK